MSRTDEELDYPPESITFDEAKPVRRPSRRNDEADEAPEPTAQSAGRWSAHEKTTIARALLAGQTAEECAAKLPGRSVAAVKAQATKVIADGKAQFHQVELPPFKRTVPGVDWEALRAELAKVTE